MQKRISRKKFLQICCMAIVGGCILGISGFILQKNRLLQNGGHVLRTVRIWLTLPGTAKKIEAKGYKGIKAYLYTGYAELAKLLLISPKYFAALHDNFSTFHYEARVQRTRFVKGIIISLTVALTLTVAFFLPTAAGLIPFIVKSGILLFSVAFSVTFFGITVHALNNFIEDVRFKVKQVTFTVFTAQELNDKIFDYRNSVNIDLENDVKNLSIKKRKIKALFTNPNAFKDGNELKMRLQRFIEACFLETTVNGDIKVQNLLMNMIYGFYITIDSLIIQESLVFGYERIGKADINDMQYDMLKFFYVENVVAFENNYDEANVIYRINNQKRIIRLFLSEDKLADIENLNAKLNNNVDIQNTILMNTTFEIMGSMESYLQRLSEKQQRTLKALTKIKRKMDFMYSSDGMFSQIGYIYMKSIQDRDIMQKILFGNEFPQEYRLYALLRLSVMEDSPFIITIGLSRFIESLGGIKENKIDMPKEIEDELIEKSREILNDKSRKLSTGDNYLDSLEAEMLFTAAAVSLHEKYPDVDLVEFLRQLKYTFVRNNNTEFIVKYTGSDKSYDPDESEYKTIAMNENYIDSIKDFVENIYKRNKGDKTEIENKNIKTVAKGPLTLIKVVRKKA